MLVDGECRSRLPHVLPRVERFVEQVFLLPGAGQPQAQQRAEQDQPGDCEVPVEVPVTPR
jgi:hypothetical protein